MRKWDARHLSDQRDYELQRQNHFEVKFISNDYITFPDDFKLAVQSFPAPNEEQEAVEVEYGNTSVNYAGTVSWGDGTITLRDFVGKRIKDTVRKWRKLAFDYETGMIGHAETYKCKGIVTEYSPDGTVTAKWDLIGCWAQSVDFGTLEHGSADNLDIEVTVQYDMAIPKDPERYWRSYG